VNVTIIRELQIRVRLGRGLKIQTNEVV